MKKQLICLLIVFLYTATGRAQLLEDFENTSGPDQVPSSNWTLGSGNWAVFDNGVGFASRWGVTSAITSPPSVYQGTNSAYIGPENIGVGNTSKDFLATDMVYIPSNGKLHFFSKTLLSGNQGTIYSIYIASANGAQMNTNAYTPVQQWTENSIAITFNNYQEIIVDLSAYYGQNVYIAFVREYSQTTPTGGGDSWFIDNVSITALSCATPTNLVALGITDNSVTLAWTNSDNSIQNAADIMLTTNGLTSIYSVATLSNSILLSLPQNQCFSASVRTHCPSGGTSEWSNSIDFCLYNCQNNADCPESLVLNAFLDSNTNGVKDSGEINFPYGSFVYQINDSGNNLYGYANNDAYYIFDANPTNSYDINFTINSNLNAYYASTVSHNNITLPTGSGANSLFFPITVTQPHLDAQCYIYANGKPVPGFSNFITLYYSNYGTQPIANGTLTYTKDPNTTISSISQSGTVATSTGFTYNFTNLAPFESRSIYVVANIPPIPTVNLGQLVTNSVTIDCANDVDLSNNNASITQVVVGSFDPNDKSEAHGGKIGLDNFTNNDYLYYTIQFENTGTANAQFIRVEDLLDAGLDESTFQMISASHTVNTKREGNQLTWHFYNINLPPTVNNPTSSHGYVHFKIKPKTGYAVGDVIPNTASIYFDYNPAIITNTCNTEFFQTLGNPSFTANTITLYPNPASNAVQITNSLKETITNIALYEVSGKLLKNILGTNESQITVDLQNLAKGLYFVEITTASNTKQIKKLIIQ